MKYITYYRVSTSKQDLGIPAQQARVENHIKENDEVLQEYQEKETGTNKRVRTELLKAITHCKETGATLLIAKLDRLARNVAFTSTLMESGVRFQALDLPNANNLTIHIYSAMAEHEANQISERTKAALSVLKAQGKTLGKPENLDNAARKKGVLAIKEKAANNVNTRPAKAYAKVLRDQGNNWVQISESLNSNGYKSSRGKKYYPHTAKRLLQDVSVMVEHA